MYGIEWWEIILLAFSTSLISMFLRGVIRIDQGRNPITDPADQPTLDPYLKSRVLPFDRNLAAVGVIEPEFIEVPDLEAWRIKVQELEAENYEPILELGSELPVAYMGQTATPDYVEAPTKLEIRWKNTLAEPTRPIPTIKPSPRF